MLLFLFHIINRGDFVICVDKNMVVIKKYQHLLIFESDYILLKKDNYLIKLIGKDFIVVYFSEYEIHISGIVKEVKFNEA